MNDGAGQKTGISAAQRGVIVPVVALTAGAVMYRLLKHERLGNSSAMFLGIPAVLAILLALTPKAKSVTGAILKGIALFLLIIAPLLGEGYLCILMACFNDSIKSVNIPSAPAVYGHLMLAPDVGLY
jgi:hypothetical protein